MYSVCYFNSEVLIEEFGMENKLKIVSFVTLLLNNVDFFVLVTKTLCILYNCHQQLV